MNPFQITPNRILEPGVNGINALPPGVERYVVRAGGATVVSLRAGDKIDVVNPEGLQPGEVAAFASDGSNNPGLLGTRANTELSGIAHALNADSEDILGVNAKLKRYGIDVRAAKGFRFFDNEAAPGASESFTAEQDGTCIVAAPGEAMTPDSQSTTTDLTLFVHRADPETAGELVELPEPLADPRVDVRIPARTAFAYEVKAGEYVQVIDVEGRECSDFQCFDSRKLEKGIERSLDATCTRYAVGAAYPAPGLFSKFYDQDFEPSFEVIRDTCGRHDSYGTACTAKYYEDLGYPGHVNCSTNFNKVLEPYGIAERKGWMAINLFFNTGVDDTNQIYFDDPWSRPGDYVLMRALKDMVCVSSACPCDVDPANGWNPTDIHLRIYPAKETFKRAVAYRMSTDSEPQLTKETGFHARTSQHTRNFTEYAGYWLANSYTKYGAIDEYWACREKSGGDRFVATAQV